MVTLDKLTSYGSHALTVGEYAPTPADPFAAGATSPWADNNPANRLARYRYDEFDAVSLASYVVARAATRALIGRTGQHRATECTPVHTSYRRGSDHLIYRTDTVCACGATHSTYPGTLRTA